MKIMAPHPKDGEAAYEILVDLGTAWRAYVRCRERYVEARQTEINTKRSDLEGLLKAREVTARRYHDYIDSIAALKETHKSWKSIFSTMVQERQL